MKPSSAVMVLIVPSTPRYLGLRCGSNYLDWSCNLTFAVSSGSVANSPMHAAVAPDNKFLRKNENSDSPSLLFARILFLNLNYLILNGL